MKSPETVHNRNLNNLGIFIDVCAAYKESYQDLQPLPGLDRMKELWREASNLLISHQDAREHYLRTISEMNAAIRQLQYCCEDIIAELRNSGNTGLANKLRLLSRALTGVIYPDHKAEVCAVPDVHEQDYEKKLAAFDNCVKILQSKGRVEPTAASPGTHALSRLGMEARELLLQVKLSCIRLHNERNTRNHLLYGGPESLIKLSAGVREQVREVFGAQSEQYMRLQKFKFQVRQATLWPGGYSLVS